MLYSRALHVPFLLDDYPIILDDPPVKAGVIVAATDLRNPRALPDISFRLNHLWTGDEPWSYHLINLMIHVINGVMVYHLARLTLHQSCSKSPSQAHWLAAVMAWLWVIHPLVSQPVIYIVQRSELMASLSFLLTLFALSKSFDQTHRMRWQITVVLACVGGFYCKPIVATLPIAALLWDRTFLTNSFKTTLKQRGVLHGLLFASLLLLAVTKTTALLTNTNGGEGVAYSAGLSVGTISSVTYLFAQSQIIWHYLWLCVWPIQLVFDYAWPPPVSKDDLILPFVLMAVLFGATLLSLGTRYAKFGILLMMVFLILATTSSIVPIFDLAVEHRMYLPSACVIAMGVMLIHRLFAGRRAVLIILMVLVSLFYMGRTYLRVGDYQSTITLWQTVIRAVPYHPRAYVIMGQELANAGQREQAALAYDRAITYSNGQPTQVNIVAHLQLAELLLQNQQTQAAMKLLEKAMDMSVNTNEGVRSLMALALRQEAATYARQRQWDKAVHAYEQLMAEQPQDTASYRVYAWLLSTCPDESIRDGAKALKLLDQISAGENSGDAAMLDIRAAALAATGDYDNAIKTVDQAIAIATSLGQKNMLKQLGNHRVYYVQGRPFLLQ